MGQYEKDNKRSSLLVRLAAINNMPQTTGNDSYFFFEALKAWKSMRIVPASSSSQKRLYSFLEDSPSSLCPLVVLRN